MTKSRSHWLAWTAALAFGLSACSDSTGPTGPFEPTEDALAVSAVQEDLAENPALASLSLLIGAPGSFAVTPLSLMRAVTEPSATEEVRAELSAWATQSSFVLSEVIPEEIRGTVYVYNPETGAYEEDPGRTGPANGVRYVLYAVDPITLEPVLPLDEIGQVDLLDQSTETTDRVRVLAKIDGVTFIDYTISRFGTEVVVTNVVGFVTNGTQVVNFDMRVEVDAVSGDSSFDIVLDAVTRGVRIHLSLDLFLDDTGAPKQIVFVYEIRTERGTVSFSVTITETTVTGDIRHGGRVVVTISGTPEAVTFTRADDGEPLTAEESAALEELLDGTVVLESLLLFLLVPAFGLVA